MKILINMGLANMPMSNHIRPIINNQEVSKIIIVRDNKGDSIENVQYLTIPPVMCKIPIMKALWRFFLLLSAAIKEKPDLIYSYMIFPHGVTGFIVSKMLGIKFGFSLLAGPLELFVYGGSPIGKFEYTNPLPKIIKRIYKPIVSHSQYIAVTGNFTKDYLVSIGAYPEKIYVIPHAVGPQFHPFGNRKDFDVAYVGRLAKVKHVEILIQVVNDLKKIKPDIQVVIVGDGTEKKDLLKQVDKHNLSDNILFVGFQNNVWDYYNRSKISIILSEREGFPFSVIESMASGVPVVASKCGDIIDVVKTGYNGILIDNIPFSHKNIL